jgi:hypothetical protein
MFPTYTSKYIPIERQEKDYKYYFQHQQLSTLPQQFYPDQQYRHNHSYQRCLSLIAQ